MRRLAITVPARADLTDIRRYTRNRFGRRAADAYDALLKRCFRDLRDNPFRLGSDDRPEIAAGIRSYHSLHSRERSAPRVKSPRHFILYFLPGDDEVVISRVLHDARDLARHVPRDHRERAQRNIPASGSEGNGRKR